MTAAMPIPEPMELPKEKGGVRKAFCAPCGRSTYVAPDAAFACPVCSSPLIEVMDKSEVDTQ